VTIRVHDSTADCRYIVLPLPPQDLDLDLVEEKELESFVKRDLLIGVTR